MRLQCFYLVVSISTTKNVSVSNRKHTSLSKISYSGDKETKTSLVNV